MKTGYSNTESPMVDNFVNSAMDLVMDALTQSTIWAGYYCKACDRKTLTAQDLEYCMKYIAQNFKAAPSLMEELSGDDDDEDDDSMEVVDEDDEPFTRYRGVDKYMLNINRAYDNWPTWIPQSPFELKFKDSINNISHGCTEKEES